jgi:hypothetical protein
VLLLCEAKYFTKRRSRAVYTNVNLAAPLGAMAFLGTAFLTFILSATLLLLLIKRKRFAARLVAATFLLVVGFYLGSMLMFSLASNQNVVPKGQEKYFCEIDCHLAYLVGNHIKVNISSEVPGNEYHFVVLRTRFDETTISAHRGNGPLAPNSRVVSIIDEQGREYFPLPEDATTSLPFPRLADGSTPITTPLRPAQSYLTSFVFDLPADVKRPVLSIRESNSLTRLIIGHENSLFHKKTVLEL